MFLSDHKRVSLSEEGSIQRHMQIVILYAAFMCQYVPVGVSPLILIGPKLSLFWECLTLKESRVD